MEYTVPTIPHDILDGLKEDFPNYIYFKTNKKSRTFWCSACGEKYVVGDLERLETPDIRRHQLIYHNQKLNCLKCGRNGEAKNLSFGLAKGLNRTSVFKAIILPVNFNEVWVRCIEYKANYDLCEQRVFDYTEYNRYRLVPGQAEFWQYIGGELTKKDIVFEPFLWQHGFFTEKYDYGFANIEALKGTFLEYNAYKEYTWHCDNFHYPMKYLSWYAIHPQIEMLVKMDDLELIKEMLMNNRDCRSFVDWSAKKPWDLYKLTKPLYNVWKCEYFGSLQILKTFRRIKGDKPKDFETAHRLNEIFTKWSTCNNKNLINFLSVVKSTKSDAESVLKYIDKHLVKCSFSSDEHRVYDTIEMWLDYIDMLKVTKTFKVKTHFPKDLKAAHDDLTSAKEFALAKIKAENDKKAIAEAIKKLKAKAKEQSAILEKKFPKCDGIYAKLHKKYEYSNGKYVIVVPKTIEDIVADGLALNHCTWRTERYYERIGTHESYIMFLRRAEAPDEPWYTLEVEPGGTVRQKRTLNDILVETDVPVITEFLKEWQAAIKPRFKSTDREKARISKKLREVGYEELKSTKKKINYGVLAGELLYDVLMQDLLETAG